VCSSDLPDSAKPAQVRKTIELLIAENAKMRDQTAALTDNLQQSQSQIKNMRSELAISRQNELTDPLTKMGNRRRFEQCLAASIVKSHETDNPMCLVVIDIDHFKAVNDTFGHQIGDQVLKFFATLIMKNLKGRDIATRYGGEEFAIILPSTNLEDAKTLMDHIRCQCEVAKLIITKRKKPIGKITASFGISILQKSDDSKSLLERADSNVYKAKEQGRNCIVSD